MDSTKMKHDQADLGTHSPPSYENQSHHQQPQYPHEHGRQESQSDSQYPSHDQTKKSYDNAPSRRLRDLLGGNFPTRVLALIMCIAAVALVSILHDRETDNDYVQARRLIISNIIIIFVAACMSLFTFLKQTPFCPYRVSSVLLLDLATLGLAIATYILVRNNTKVPPIDDMMYARRAVNGLMVATGVMTVIGCLRSVFQLGAWMAGRLPGTHQPYAAWFWGRTI